MRIDRLDHFVLTVADLDATIDFYTGVLGMEEVTFSGRKALAFGRSKINLHEVRLLGDTRKAQVDLESALSVGDDRLTSGGSVAAGVFRATDCPRAERTVARYETTPPPSEMKVPRGPAPDRKPGTPTDTLSPERDMPTRKGPTPMLVRR